MKDQNKLYLNILIGICSLALAFHFLILIKAIPYENTWGGKLKSDQEMYVFEFFSMAINTFFLYVLLQKGNYVKPFFSEKLISIFLWTFFAIFSLNTIGNLFAETIFEKSFSILTLLNAVLIWLINKPTLR
ncbi:MAG: hypothetical protein IPO62_08910 [Saprospiraceae bacterium]|nr:hypothetical protein [Saprospiraceae bacterium]MBK9631173.1 hypothetical protein [Saprospiraceae bacterium]